MQPNTLTRRETKVKFMLRIFEKINEGSEQDPDPKLTEK